MKTMGTLKALALTLAAAAAALGCSAKTDDGAVEASALSEDGSDASEVESQTSALTATLTLSAGNLTDVAQAASDAAETRAFFSPGCMTTTVDTTANVATHVFKSCEGPWGLAHLTGTITVRYAAATSPDGKPAVKLELEGDALAIGRAAADYRATALIVPDGSSRAMTWNADLTGTTARGRRFARTAAWNVTWTVGESCIDVDGTAEGKVGERTLKTTVTNLQRCRGECPAAGGAVKVIDVKTSDAVTIEYTGGGTALLSSSSGATYEVSLACGDGA